MLPVRSVAVAPAALAAPLYAYCSAAAFFALERFTSMAATTATTARPAAAPTAMPTMAPVDRPPPLLLLPVPSKHAEGAGAYG